MKRLIHFLNKMSNRGDARKCSMSILLVVQRLVCGRTWLESDTNTLLETGTSRRWYQEWILTCTRRFTHHFRWDQFWAFWSFIFVDCWQGTYTIALRFFGNMKMSNLLFFFFITFTWLLVFCFVPTRTFDIKIKCQLSSAILKSTNLIIMFF